MITLPATVLFVACCAALAHASDTCRHVAEPIAPENFIYRSGVDNNVNGNFGFTTDSTALSSTGKVTFDASKMTADKVWNTFSYRPQGAKRDWRQYDGFRLKVRVETEGDTHPDRHGYFNGYGDMNYHQLKQMADQTAGAPQDFYSVVRQHEKGNEVLGPELGNYQKIHGTGMTVADVPDLPNLSKNVQTWARGQYRFYMKLRNEDSGGAYKNSLDIQLLDVTKGGVEIPKSTADPKRRMPSVTYSFDFRFDNITDPKLCNPDLRQWDKYGDVTDSAMYTPVLAETATAGDDFIKVKGGGLPANPSAEFLARLQENTRTTGRHITTDFVDAGGVNGLKVPKSLGRVGSSSHIAKHNATTGVYTIYLLTNAAKNHHVQRTMPPGTVIKIWPRPPRRYQGPNCYLNKIGSNEIEGYGVTAPRDNVYELSISPYMRKERWIGYKTEGDKTFYETMSLTFSEIELYKCDYTCAEHKSLHKQKGCCAVPSRI